MTWPSPHLLGRVGAVVLVAVALCGASAASLGGVDAGGLGAWVLDVDIDVDPPGPVACSTFDTDGPLAGQSDGCDSSAWNTTGGNWHVVGGKLKANATQSIAWSPGPSPYLTVDVDVIGTDKKNSVGGAIVSFDPATGSHIAAILVGPDIVQLRTVSGGSTTVLGAFSISLPADTRLTLSRNTTQVIVSLDGVPVLSAPIDPTSFPGTATGLYHGGGPAVEFDDYVVTNP